MTTTAAQAQTCRVKYRIADSNKDVFMDIFREEGYPNELDFSVYPFREQPPLWHIELIVAGWKPFRDRYLAQGWGVMTDEYRIICLHVAERCGIADAAQDHAHDIGLDGNRLVDRYIDKYVMQHPQSEKVGPYLAWRGVETIYREFRGGDHRVAAYCSAYLARHQELKSQTS